MEYWRGEKSPNWHPHPTWSGLNLKCISQQTNSNLWTHNSIRANWRQRDLDKFVISSFILKNLLKVSKSTISFSSARIRGMIGSSLPLAFKQNKIDLPKHSIQLKGINELVTNPPLGILTTSSVCQGEDSYTAHLQDVQGNHTGFLSNFKPFTAPKNLYN